MAAKGGSEASNGNGDGGKDTSSKAQDNGDGGKEPQKTSQGHELTSPPYTGWDGPVPSSDGGSSEAGYLVKPPYAWHSDEFKPKWTASCWCGKLKLEYAGDPVDAKHCHCHQCQSLHGAPFQWAALFHKTSVRLAADCDPLYLDFFSTQQRTSEHHVPCKISCRNCRSPMADEGRNMVMAYPSSFGFAESAVPAAFKPSAHIFYAERVMDLDDGVPKWAGHKEASEQMSHDTGDPTRMGLQGAGGGSKRRRQGEDADEKGAD